VLSRELHRTMSCDRGERCMVSLLLIPAAACRWHSKSAMEVLENIISHISNDDSRFAQSNPFRYTPELGDGTHDLVELVRDGKPGRYGRAAQCRLARGRQIVEDVTVLLLQRGHDGHHGLHKPGAFWAVSPKAAFAPEHAGPDGTFGRIELATLGCVRVPSRTRGHP